ncbi:MAG: OmpA family protein [Deltaproteobacteria bacterium]|nr:OmpA family protein [Deltaproteobacteria bacterium]
MMNRIPALALSLTVLAGCASSRTNTAETRPTEPAFASDRSFDHGKTEEATGEIRQALIHLQRVHFAYDSARLLPSGQQALVEAAERLAKYPAVAIHVEGHADHRGDAKYNLRLSELRAQAVMRFLVQHGISADRLAVESYGFSRPLEAGAAPQALAANRRADFRLMRGDVELVIDGGVLVDDKGRPMAARTAAK